MFVKKVQNFIRQHHLFNPKETIVIGVSGGVDSLMLLYFLQVLAKDNDWQLIVAHVNHMFREASETEYRFVKEICGELGVTFEGAQIDVPAEITLTNENPQLVARNLRYKFYTEVMQKFQADKLALAHHLDDQAETILMHLTRGAASPEKIGIPFSRGFATGQVVRPFLSVTKQEIITYCEEHGYSYFEDESNAKSYYTRNRVRHKILPLIKEENQQALSHFAEFYQMVHEDNAFLAQLAKEHFKKIAIEAAGNRYVINLDDVSNLVEPLQRRVLTLILEYLCSKRAFTHSNVHIKMIQTLVTAIEPSAILQLQKNFYVIKSFGELIFRFEQPTTWQYDSTIPIEGIVQLPNGDYIEARLVKEIEEPIPTESRLNTVCIPTKLFPLRVRNKHNGDRILLTNLGRKKVKKLFLEKQIPIELRESWPIVTTQRKELTEILWVPGLAIAAGIPESEQPYVWLTFHLSNSTIQNKSKFSSSTKLTMLE